MVPFKNTADVSGPTVQAHGQDRKAYTSFYMWLKSWNISMASERKQRELAEDLTGGIQGELVSFSFPDRRRDHVMQLAPEN